MLALARPDGRLHAPPCSWHCSSVCVGATHASPSCQTAVAERGARHASPLRTPTNTECSCNGNLAGWSPSAPQPDCDVNAEIKYNSRLVVHGKFEHAQGAESHRWLRIGSMR